MLAENRGFVQLILLLPSSDHEVIQAILTQMLYSSIVLLGERFESSILELWFLSTFPKFGGLHPQEGDTERSKGLDVLKRAAVCSMILTASLS